MLRKPTSTCRKHVLGRLLKELVWRFHLGCVKSAALQKYSGGALDIDQPKFILHCIETNLDHRPKYIWLLSK